MAALAQLAQLAVRLAVELGREVMEAQQRPGLPEGQQALELEEVLRMLLRG